MNGTTLQALRRLLFFSVDEASLLIGHVSPRSWQYWERGERSIPGDVAGTMLTLTRWRASALVAARAQIAESQAESSRLIWYNSLDDWATIAGREPEYWRPHCSVVAALAAELGVMLIPFDGVAYQAWLGNMKDTEAMRGAWCASL